MWGINPLFVTALILWAIFMPVICFAVGFKLGRSAKKVGPSKDLENLFKGLYPAKTLPPTVAPPTSKKEDQN